MEKQPGDSGIGRGYGAGYAIFAAGFQLVASILFFMAMGYFLDRWLGTAPAFMLVGIVVGLAAGFYVFLLRVKAAARDIGASGRGGGA